MFIIVLKGCNNRISGPKGLTAYLEKENKVKRELKQEHFFTYYMDIVSSDGEISIQHDWRL